MYGRTEGLNGIRCATCSECSYHNATVTVCWFTVVSRGRHAWLVLYEMEMSCSNNSGKKKQVDHRKQLKVYSINEHHVRGRGDDGTCRGAVWAKTVRQRKKNGSSLGKNGSSEKEEWV